MKIVAPFLLVCAGLAASSIYYWQASAVSELRALYLGAHGNLRVRHMAKLGLAQRAEPEDYGNAMKGWLSGYFRDLSGLKKRAGFRDVANEYGDDVYLNDLTAKKDSRAITEKEFEEDKEYYDFTKQIYDKMRGGNYEPELTATANGFRMDLFNIRKEDFRGNDTVKADYVIWGNPGDIAYGGFETTICLGPNTYLNKDEAMKEWDDWTKEALEIIRSHIEAEQDNLDEVARANRERPKPLETIFLEGFGGDVKLPLDEEAFLKSLCMKNGRIKTMADNSQPDFIMNRPQDKIADFPPGATIGWRQLVLVPHHTKYVNMNMTFQLPSTAGTMIDTPLIFENAEFDESWRMEPGRR